MTSIAENIALTLTRIREAEAQSRRSPHSVKLLAVSKTRPASELREAYAEGIRDFGENYLQDALAKIELLADLDISWHFIGPLQSNKTRPVAEHFHWVHSVDRLKIARRLSEQRPESMPPLNLCVQVNISEELNKSGVLLDEAEELVREIGKLDNLRIRGLMAIPQAGLSEQQQRQTFGRLHNLLEHLKTVSPNLDTLSMGMSQDMNAAVAEGATIVRIGTAIFGARN
ncbi:YggS family pyridoxal phosphate-dependent enzyme [Motiliproteus sp. MSK22-1]|uniref:YggS family pyridoxal phosphate-dependent enzyme n=1 Tax=Motiliproteus sp. MSK22-1 TaxID=1897630 RepID=UPI000978850D|nr:YggS family pyridoxal phosphate-dependent enzyme [Motiliproteus sp. MSK22-1]OMH39573.1 YggS family pyridoxal phosphate enzyme [Motiliproteus sp. MSK22-1]